MKLPYIKTSENAKLLLLSLIVGLCAGVAAVVLLKLIGFVHSLIRSGHFIFPAVGMLISLLLVRFVVKDNIGHGVTKVLLAVSRNESRIKPHNMWSSLLTSAVTIGLGGSVGAEAPIVLTGSAIGSNLGQLFHMDRKTLMTLVGCGAAGAIAGIFKAPIAGLVFAIEVLLIDMTMSSLLPILVSCVTATCFTYIFSGDASLFTFHLDNEWNVQRIPACLMLGIFCGLTSLYFIRTMSFAEGIFARFKNKPYVKLAIGGSLLSLLIFLFPSLFGEGYHSINLLLNGKTEADWAEILNNSLFAGHTSMLMIYVALVLLTKVFATSATNGGGGCGGTFAPSLFVGCFAGFFFSRLWNIYEVGVYVPEKNFALMGMAGVMSGVMHAPLTGIFLIAELTGGYNLLLPLMIVSVSSYLTIIIFEPHSIYGARLAKEGKLLTHHTDHAALTLMNLDSVIERDYEAVSPNMELGQIVNRVSRSRSTMLPVIDASGALLGEIDIMSIRKVMFRMELYHHFLASQLMKEPAATLRDTAPMTSVMRTFEATHADWLPVLTTDGHLKGYISRRRLYTLYRKMVHDMSED